MFRLALTTTLAVGCADEASHTHSADEVSSVIHSALFTNGDFENDAIGAVPSGWTSQHFLNPSITDLSATPPQTLASLNLTGSGSDANGTNGIAGTLIVGGSAESQTDPDLGAGTSPNLISLRFPKYGTRAVRLNYNPSGSPATSGTNTNVNALRQTMTIANGDVDTSDNKAHIRFAIAPVLQNPNHAYTQQPYYFVRLQNITKGTTLYSDFNTSGQLGVPWKTNVGASIFYTDWQLVDIAPGNAALAIGDQVELLVIASGCAAGGHWGRVYVDGIGSTVPGIYTYATGPTSANAGSNITYVVRYKNGGTGSAAVTKVDTVIPTGTTFQSVSIPGACTAPAVGATGTVSCTIGTLAAGGAGSFTITVKINSATTGTITNGNYSIYATGVNALLGPKVFTTVTSNVTYADIAVTKTDGVAATSGGLPLTYTIVATNNGPSTAPTVTVADTMPSQIGGVTWTCVGAGGGSCSTASGSGNLSGTVALPVGASATYTVSATVNSGLTTGSIINSATATLATGVSDPDTSNNTAVDTDNIGVLRTLSVTKTGAAGGTVATVPSSISCGAGCSSASGSFVNGTGVVITASAVAGGSFSGWGGACTSAGTNPTCNLTMTADQSVSATFVPPPTITVSSGSGQSAATSTAFGSSLTALVVDSSGNPLSGTTVVFSAPASGASATLSATSAVTNGSGLASITVTANGTAGAYVVTAGISGTAATTTFSLSNYGSPVSISVVSGSGQSATVGTAFSAPLIVVVRDTVSQIVPGVTVTFTAPSSGARATLSAATATTNASGQASITATAHQIVGSYSVTGAVTGISTPATFTLTNTVSSAANITVISGSGQSATVGTAFGASLVAKVSDTFGNAITGATVTFVAASSGASAMLANSGTALTNSSGQASMSATANTVAGAHSVSASASGAGSVSFSLSNTAGAAASTTATSGGSQLAQVSQVFGSALLVTVRDTYGNLVSGATVTFAAPGSGASASLGSTSVTTNAQGQASTTATANATAGSYAVTGSVSGVGSPASFSLTNYNPLALTPATTTVAPRGTATFVASGGSGGGRSFALTSNGSGGNINASTGAYTAGATPSTTDVVTVTDSLSNTAIATIIVGPGIALSPATTTVAPRASFTFTATGGSGTGFAFALTSNGSGGSISASTGAYTAGQAPSTTDVVTVTDSLGNVRIATITVGPGISLSPATTTVAPRASVTFSATGGSGAGFSFVLSTNGSTGTINASTGAYTAGQTPSTADVVTVTDSLGNTATGAIAVGPSVSVSPATATAAPRASISFTASGGSGAGFAFALTGNGSGGTVDPTTGAYVAGATPSTTDVVTVTDSLGNTAIATITVGAGISVSPATATAAPRASVSFTASGGSGSAYAFALTTNGSGGTVNAATGAYTAGPAPSTTDVVTVSDSLGNTATATITVGAAISVLPVSPAAAPRGGLTFSATGGSGTGFVFALSTNASGGTINATTGAYVAGTNPSVVDIVTATDSLGNVAAANVAVGPGISVTPASPAAAPRGTVNLVAAGGSGTGFSFVVSTNTSGGSVNPSTGVYTAGGTGSTVDIVTISDSFGNSTTVSVSVGGGLTVSPLSPTVVPRDTQAFQAAGGSGTGFTFTITTNGSGGVVNPSTGAYTAGSTGGVNDVITVVDSLGSSATTTVHVGPGVQILPATPTLAPLGALSFMLSGGSGAGYTFNLSTNASGGSINASTGAYVAGGIGGVGDVVTVTDSLGNVAVAMVTVTPALAPVQGNITVAPREARTLGVTGGAGGNAFALSLSGSGGTIDPVTGAYMAGSAGGTADLVTITDQNGAVTSIAVTVGPGLSILPAVPAVAPRGMLTLTASGGSGVGYQFALANNLSGGTVNPSSGAYVAGGVTDVVDVVGVTDSLGNAASVGIVVGNGIVVSPSAPSVAPRAHIAFATGGGSGSGYVYALTMNLSGGTIDSSSGAYVAGSTPSVVDVVTVTDTLTNSFTVNVSVGPGVSVAPASSAVAPQATIALTVSGGSGTGYVFALATNASGATIDPSSGRYVAGLTPSVTDTVTATDSLGNSDVATIQVGAGIIVSAASQTVAPRGTVALAASGGSGSYTFVLQTNGSGASVVSTTGVYTAGAMPNTTDVVAVSDTLGNTASIQIAIGPGVSIAPASPVVAPAGTVTFTATGGSGTGFTFVLNTNGSGGTIDSATGVYVAGASPDATDVVTVTDSLGNSATVGVVVGQGVGLSPHAPIVAPRGNVQLAAVGGSGTGYTYALTTNSSGGQVDPSTGLYTAGATGNVTDVVMATDSLGKSGTVQISVSAGVSLTPATSNVAPGTTITFTVGGGSGNGYVFGLITNASGGSIDPVSGLYEAGLIGSVTDVVQVVDALGNSAIATLMVGATLTVTPLPPAGTLPPRGTEQIAVTGGAGPYTFGITSNGTGGQINTITGQYTAGSTGGGTDVISVTDANGVTRTISVTVGAGVSLTPVNPEVRPGGTVALHASGGSGMGYAFRIVSAAGGGSVDAATGKYTAPARSVGGSDIVELTDSLGNTARGNVKVTASTGSLGGGGGCDCDASSGVPARWTSLLVLIALILPRRRRKVV